MYHGWLRHLLTAMNYVNQESSLYTLARYDHCKLRSLPLQFGHRAKLYYTIYFMKQCPLLLVQTAEWLRMTTMNVFLEAHFLLWPVWTIRTLKLWHFATFKLKVTPQWWILTITFSTFCANVVPDWLRLQHVGINILIQKKIFSWSDITKRATHTAGNL
jgi:hypothetical protein